jgi:large subunit ribosomal protein L21
MYAIAKSGGKQFKIQQNSTVRVPTLKAAVGDKVRLDSILMLSRGDSVAVGAPLVDGAYAEAHVVRHGRSSKIQIIKYKRRKNYRRTIGHRQGYTELMIDAIVEEAASGTKVSKKAGKKTEPVVEEPQTATVEAVAEPVVENPQAAPDEAAAESAEAKPRRSRKKSAEAAEGESAPQAE